eukprot:5217116-Lingulodinium_polyedra.AAC.1
MVLGSTSMWARQVLTHAKALSFTAWAESLRVIKPSIADNKLFKRRVLGSFSYWATADSNLAC